ncbi:hypothetical protein BpHYR1_031954 [Brachionus plicatilis]|uniref:Uncharacterized protein n=1 Tax=Brachionus plicatilis TaxID=10195 RepID=A0A3M7S3I1_BRAPC|nr:hypothetical protein BpHYR1_031954 [Brachionus plicatilis]
MKGLITESWLRLYNIVTRQHARQCWSTFCPQYHPSGTQTYGHVSYGGMPVSFLGVIHRSQFRVVSLSCARSRCSRSTTKDIPWFHPSLDNWIFQARALFVATLNDLTAETKPANKS